MWRAWIVVVVLAGGARTARADDPAPACTADRQLDRPGESVGSGGGPHVTPRELVGKKLADVVAKYGAPGCQSKRLVRIWIPDGCAYEKTVLSLWLRRGRVTRATVVRIVTGEECADVD